MASETDYPPSGCTWCGARQRFHWNRWSSARDRALGNGGHTYEPPTDAQIKARMLERRAERHAVAQPPADVPLVTITLDAAEFLAAAATARKALKDLAASNTTPTTGA